MPKVSVIIPTYNRAPWVTEAVSSVLAQTYRDYELLVVDDASQDDTLEALAPFLHHLIFLRQPEQRGVSAARNLGIIAARGEWLTFLDSDDLWRPAKLARQMEFLAAYPDLLICQTEEIWLRHGKKVNPPLYCRKPSGHIFLPSLKRCLISPSAVMLHRRLFAEVGLFDEALPAAEDYDLWLRLTWRHPVGLLSEPLVIKRGGHPDQLSRQWGLDRFRIRALQKILAQPDLPPHYQEAALDTLTQKCKLYAQGCAKRGKVQEALIYTNLMVASHKGACHAPIQPL